MLSANAEPYEFDFDPATTALVMIDFQRDFVYPGGFGESLGNDTSLLLKALPAAERVLKACRAAGHLRHPHPRGPPGGPVRPAGRQVRARPPDDPHRRPGPDGSAARPRRVRARHRRRGLPDRGRADRRQAGQGRVLRDGHGRDPQDARHPPADRVRRDHRGVRPDQRPRGERPRATTPSCSRTASGRTSRSSRRRPST